MAAKDIIVIGASAGGFDAITKLVAGFPADLAAAVFVTIHVNNRSDGILPRVISRAGPLLATHASDGEAIRHGKVYVAPPDYHLLLCPEYVQLSHGPRENLQRPCINAMFRSAAAAYGDRVTGVLLTGLLDDGAAGLWEIQQKKGATVVQDPEEATFRSMPDSAIRGLNVQHIVRIAEMAPLLTNLAMADHTPPSSYLPGQSAVEETRQTCPECGGAMTAFRMGPLREYRCHVGHRFGVQTMIEQKAINIERVLERALAQSEELSGLLKAALDSAQDENLQDLKKEFHRREREQQTLRSLSGNPRQENVPPQK